MNASEASGVVCPKHGIVHHPDFPCEKYEESRQVALANTTIWQDDATGIDFHPSGFTGPAVGRDTTADWPESDGH